MTYEEIRDLLLSVVHDPNAPARDENIERIADALEAIAVSLYEIADVFNAEPT